MSNVSTGTSNSFFFSVGNLQAHFSVYATRETGRPWGVFTTDTEVSPELGPSSGDTILVQESKVSNHGGPWDWLVCGSAASA